ncbi:nuclear transport factor 2 family protein [Herbaspirillum sp. LeCh32-8]|uniref:YybH family protein n=1 Tax=Herbaspirillum sp. LeCh32-8 TaxID=2821356 RepID=UPI001AE7D8DF|nr:nuclear transport factor 2 family protein [Herbaspirillum sp. LeCh32-8]MBP0599133.1 nuclear transport factor 2 family protein [Herbaspirillum sp. LeCh32-8]
MKFQAQCKARVGRWYFLIVSVAMMAGLTVTAPASAATPEEEIRAMSNEMLAAANEHNVDKHLKYYVKEPDLIFVYNTKKVRGWDALHVQQTAWWGNGKTDAVYTREDQPVFQVLSPDLMLETASIGSVRTQADGKQLRSMTIYSAVWQKRPEGWRIVYCHESS